MLENGELVIPSIGKLYYEGNIALLQKKIVCVIGTRNPSEKGKNRARMLSRIAIEQGFVPLSGLAKGIDTEVHNVMPSSTIAVIPTALDRMIYPKENLSLKEKIIEEGGLIISPFANGSTLSKASFIIRDKVQGFLSLFVVVVESDITGGSMHALSWAVKHNRNAYIFDDEKRLTSLRNQTNIKLINDETMISLFD